MGYVEFDQCVAGLCASSPSFDFQAAFYTSSGSSTGGCTVTTSGTCYAYACSADAGTSAPAVSAGTIHIGGGNLGAGQSITPGTDGTYLYSASAVDYSAGQTLTITASGSVVPAFGPQSIFAPSLVDLTSPSASDAGTYTIPTSSDLPVAWTGGQSGDAFTLQGADSTGLNFFTCT